MNVHWPRALGISALGIACMTACILLFHRAGPGMNFPTEFYSVVGMIWGVFILLAVGKWADRDAK